MRIRLSILLLAAALAIVFCPGTFAEEKLTIVGVWKEHWDPGEETDVTYNDEYAVGLDGKGRAKVLALSRNQTIEKEKFVEGQLSFTLHTSFPVRYSLVLQDGGKKMSGTATTPDRTVKIIWERIR